MGEAVLHSRALLRLGRIAYLQADYIRAQMLLVETLSLFQQMRAPSAVAEAQFELGRVARAQGDELEARRLLMESLAGYRDFWSNKREVASCLEELAGLAAMNRQAAHAVRLFGAAQALRERANTPLPPVYQPGYERDVAAARTQLDAATFAACGTWGGR
jgi:tetratricopeptide repeat protein